MARYTNNPATQPTALDLPNLVISFLPSQLASISQTPLPYTANPRKLLQADLLLFFSKFTYVLGIIRPWRVGSKAEKWDELYFSYVNIKSLILHATLICFQLFFIASLPFFIITPTFWLLLWITGFMFVSNVLCKLLNGDRLSLEPSQEVLDQLQERKCKDNSSEHWVFLNGVSVGRDWLQSNIDRLSLTFGRKVHGVLNSTDGIVFDLVQCLVQRNFYYATNDIRAAYVSIREKLYDEKIKKVVFILHSQGGIEGGLIIDWLLAEVPQDILGRLEVYTFGCAANHFNNPQRAAVCPAGKPLTNLSSHGAPSNQQFPKAIGHIEHYANEGDFVANIGVLNYAKSSPEVRNRYMGRIFISPNSGHLMNQHYLHTMFPLGDNEKCLDSNAFMDANINVLESTADDEREGAGVDEIHYSGDVDSPISSLHLSSSVVRDGPLKVKDMSRLWLYRNGSSPPDKSVNRAATLA